MLKIRAQTYCSIIFAIAIVAIVNILKPTSLCHTFIITLAAAIFFGICINLLKRKPK